MKFLNVKTMKHHTTDQLTIILFDIILTLIHNTTGYFLHI